MRLSFAAIICAAGSSSRMGGVKKEYRLLPSPDGKPISVLGAAVRAFASIPEINPIVITVPPGGEEEAGASLPEELFLGGANGAQRQDPVSERGPQPRVLFAQGGPTRRASVHNALLLLEHYHPSHVLIHDGARPWIRRGLIEKIMEAAVKYRAVIPALPLIETPKELEPSHREGRAPAEAALDRGIPGRASAPAPAADSSASGRELGFIKRHLRRPEVCGAQTPQAFAFPEILEAHEKAAEREKKDLREYTDDAEVWSEFSGAVAIISGDPENRKITFPEDLPPLPRPEESGMKREAAPTQRIGLGKDLHRLAAGRRFLLGGVEIPFAKGELGHSDGDVLAHAVCDALLGAAGLGDIGELFPPGDPAWKDADSLQLLKSAWSKVEKEGWRVVNIDCVLSCEAPKILPYREQIRRSLAEALGIEAEAIFVKGKTNEGLGPLGKGEAVEAFAVCLIERRGKKDPRGGIYGNFEF